MSIHQPAAGPPKGRRKIRLTSSFLTGALLITALAPLAAMPAQAATAGTGPVSTLHGYPEWYDDGTVKLALCYEAGKGCLSEPPDTELPVSYPGNFPDEAFWFAASSTVGAIGSYEAALEAAHLNDAVVSGEQIGFGRLRFRFEGLQANADYTVTHPYGVNVLRADALGIINQTIDDGCLDVPCDWDAVGQAFLGEYAVGTTATFLRQTGTPPAGTIGDINTARTVTGAPSGNNFVSVVGPGINVTSSLFTVQGLITTVADGAPSTPNLDIASDTGRSSADNITNDSTPTFSGTATAGANVELVVDDTGTGVTTVATDGAYSLTATTVLADGAHTIQARITDPVAGELTSNTLQMTVDTVVPAAATFTSTPSNPSADSSPSFSFTGETNAAFECQLLPSNEPWRACTSPQTYDAQVNGDYTFNVRATDAAGNTGVNASYAWRIGSATPPPPAAAEQKDMTSDGNADVVARDSAGVLWLYPGNGTGGFQARTQIGTGWNVMSAILQPGDWNSDGRADLMARDGSGNLWLYRGNGAGGVATRVQVGAGWNVMTSISTPGDFNADGRADLIARDSSGRLFFYPGNGALGFGTRAQIGSGWNVMTSIFGPGDWNGDGRADLMARDGDGRLFLYPGNGRGGFAPRSQPGSGWNIMTAITGAGQWDAGTTADLLARDSSGRLWLYRGGGAGGFGTRTQIGSGWNGYTIVQ